MEYQGSIFLVVGDCWRNFRQKSERRIERIEEIFLLFRLAPKIIFIIIK